MAHFAELDENNCVVKVIVIHNNELLDNGVELESKGIVFCKSLFGENTKWVQTSYNGSFRKNYAGVGFTYDQNRNAFIPPKPFPSWLLEENTCLWVSPIEYPKDEKKYRWSEEDNSWVEIINVYPF